MITRRKCLKEEINAGEEQARKRDLTSRHRQLNRDVKKSTTEGKNECFNALATKTENAAGQQHLTWSYVVGRTR